jgi:hypothetical protein
MSWEVSRSPSFFLDPSSQPRWKARAELTQRGHCSALALERGQQLGSLRQPRLGLFPFPAPQRSIRESGDRLIDGHGLTV